MQLQYNAIPIEKQSGPLFAVISPTAGLKIFEKEAEADADAAQQFSASGGKQPVYCFTLVKVALPAVPKIEFTEAKKA